MSAAKLISKGLKLVECKHGVGRENSPICYIPKQDPVQDALEKTKRTTYFKQTLPNTRNELKVVIWASMTPFLSGGVSLLEVKFLNGITT